MKKIDYLILVFLVLVIFSCNLNAYAQTYSQMEESRDDGLNAQHNKSWEYDTSIKDKKDKNQKEGYINIIEDGTMKEYVPNAVWRDKKCVTCNGTGFLVKSYYDARRNRMIKTQEVCYRCCGTGVFGGEKK